MGTDNGPGKRPAILPIEVSPSSERTGLLGDDTLYKLGMFRLAGRTSEECKDLKFAPEKDGAVPHTKWYMTSFLIAGEVMGAGLLALPVGRAPGRAGGTGVRPSPGPTPTPAGLPVDGGGEGTPPLATPASSERPPTPPLARCGC